MLRVDSLVTDDSDLGRVSSSGVWGRKWVGLNHRVGGVHDGIDPSDKTGSRHSRHNTLRSRSRRGDWASHLHASLPDHSSTVCFTQSPN